MRGLFAGVLLLFAGPAALANMGGIEFLRLCERDAVPCAGIIREQLKSWPKRVLDTAALKKGRLEHLTCPPHQPDQALAESFVAQVQKRRIRLDGKTVHEAIEETFTAAFPACASSRDS